MKQKALFIANTPYQLMVIINMTFNEYAEFECDVIISDRISQYQELAERVKNQNVFCNVFVIPLGKIFPQDRRFKAIINKYKNWDVLGLHEYDVVLFANLNYDISCIYRYLRKKNSDIRIYMFEDGFASYSQYYSLYISKFSCQTKSIKNWFHYFVNEAFRFIRGMYLFTPGIITYETYFPIIKLQTINPEKRALLNLYNRVFNYCGSCDDYKEKVIFF